eukprot:12918013-Prorocentrum_lima.AAC.1
MFPKCLHTLPLDEQVSDSVVIKLLNLCHRQRVYELWEEVGAHDPADVDVLKRLTGQKPKLFHQCLVGVVDLLGVLLIWT